MKPSICCSSRSHIHTKVSAEDVSAATFFIFSSNFSKLNSDDTNLAMWSLFLYSDEDECFQFFTQNTAQYKHVKGGTKAIKRNSVLVVVVLLLPEKSNRFSACVLELEGKYRSVPSVC